ncbi:MAG: flagellar biosynthesis protein FlhA [Actinomycetota bacterium]|nr:flagellar biosynthesis protein FlhA [Actinomycetota bacterium]
MRTRIGTIGVPAGVVAIVVMLVVPLPAFVLDFLIVMNITAAVLVLLTAMRVRKALDFSVFPSLLLVATMFRLALNVSATRLVLLHGYAGHVIHAFGHFVVGGSLVVGLVVFLILIVIQFVVVTNGAGRVAEVAARFTLDAMPGKQMAIDADLNAGLIDADTARVRRREVGAEADFYGAMDGASKFVKGDAVAAIVITLINLVGGLAVGVLQRHMPIGQAISTYSLLSVGDGLVSQIPALLLSVSTGLVVTRATTEDEFGTDILAQFARQAGAVRLAGIVISVLGLVPGLPRIPFLMVGAGAYLIGRSLGRTQDREAAAEAIAQQVEPVAALETTEALAPEMRVEPLELELSYDLLDLVDTARGGDLLDRVKALRRQLAIELGLVVPTVRTRDNLELGASTYAIRLHDVEVGRGQAPAGRVLAVGDSLDGIPGEPTREPVFGLPSKWVPTELRHEAMVTGATVVDRAAVLTTHLAELVRRNASALLTRTQVKELMDVVREAHPVVVDELATAQVTLGEVQHVLRELLAEGVPIRDLVRILEAVSERARVSRDAEGMVEAARAALGPSIVSRHAVDGALPVLTLDPALEQQLVDALRVGDDGTFLAIDPALLEQLAGELSRLSTEAEHRGRQPVLVCAARLRPAARRFLRSLLPRLAVLSVNELSGHVRADHCGVVSVATSAGV